MPACRGGEDEPRHLAPGKNPPQVLRHSAGLGAGERHAQGGRRRQEVAQEWTDPWYDYKCSKVALTKAPNDQKRPSWHLRPDQWHEVFVLQSKPELALHERWRAHDARKVDHGRDSLDQPSWQTQSLA